MTAQDAIRGLVEFMTANHDSEYTTSKPKTGGDNGPSDGATNKAEQHAEFKGSLFGMVNEVEKAAKEMKDMFDACTDKSKIIDGIRSLYTIAKINSDNAEDGMKVYDSTHGRWQNMFMFSSESREIMSDAESIMYFATNPHAPTCDGECEYWEQIARWASRICWNLMVSNDCASQKLC